ncbi:hypothetical protein [Archangium lansingense]|uniref:Uncharacterized protein n=1 Tax=Archangium lansingense TaxID=2995310 RepID=A0ABT4A303_9BACT|nr:hypothetical protein [Archangium lansinium]MCY1076033.1 hypothetical protein [Archangium lansinium]
MSLNSSPIPLSVESLLALVHNYYRADKEFHLRRENSPEEERFLTLWVQERKKMDQWNAFVDELQAALPELDVGNITSTCNASFRCAVYPRVEFPPPEPGIWVVVGCVSILAPVYAIYGLHLRYSGRQRIEERVFLELLPPEMQGPAEVVASKLEATFGVTALPRALARTPVPLIVEPKEPPHTTLFDALFISRPESVPI